MATVRMMIKKTDKPSEEQLKSLCESNKKTICFDEDSPEMTPEMLTKFRRVNPKRRTMVN